MEFKNLNNKEFNNIFTKKDNYLINNENKNTILTFSALSWCGPCKILHPILLKLSGKYQDISFYEIDVDEEYDLSSRFNIKSVPTILFISSKGEVNQQIGALSESQIEKLILKYFKSEQ